MKNQILPFIRYAFFCTILLSTAAMAMEQPNRDELREMIRKISLKSAPHPVPPPITYADYCIKFCSEDGEIDGWGKASSNLGSWLQSSTNQATLINKEGIDLDDFPLFQVTLNPVLEGTMLRCDYSMPIIVSDSNDEFPILSLFYDASKSEIESVIKLKSEPFMDYTRRLLHWQEELKKRQAMSNSIESRIILGYKFVPQVNQRHESFLLAFDRQSARKRSNFIYLDLSADDGAITAKTFLNPEGGALEDFEEGNVEYYKQDGSTNLLFANYAEDTRTNLSYNYLYSDDSIKLKSNYFSINDCLFDITGDFTLTAQKISLSGDNPNYFWPVGSLTFKSPEESCPIANIKIFPADSTHPIRVNGDLEFTENPKVTLELLNVSRVNVKLRERTINGNRSL